MNPTEREFEREVETWWKSLLKKCDGKMMEAVKKIKNGIDL